MRCAVLSAIFSLPTACCRLRFTALCPLLRLVGVRVFRLPSYRPAPGCAKLRLAFPHVGQFRGCPLGNGGSVDSSRDVRSGSSDAAYASIAAIVALFLRSSKMILSNVSRFVCHVYCRYSE